MYVNYALNFSDQPTLAENSSKIKVFCIFQRIYNVLEDKCRVPNIIYYTYYLKYQDFHVHACNLEINMTASKITVHGSLEWNPYIILKT